MVQNKSKRQTKIKLEQTKPEENTIQENTPTGDSNGFLGKITDSGLMIFIMTIVAYSASYCFDWGYKDYYHIPLDFIEMDITSITQNLWIMVPVFVFPILYILFLQDTDLRKTVDRVERKIKREKKMPTKVNLALQLIALFMAMLFSWNFFHQKSEPVTGVRDLMLAILCFIAYASLKKYTVIASMGTLILYVTFIYVIGASQAQQQDTYLKVKGSNFVVVDYYKNTAVIAPVDLKKKEITPEFKFIKLESDKTEDTPFELVNTGVLKVKEPAKIK